MGSLYVYIYYSVIVNSAVVCSAKVFKSRSEMASPCDVVTGKKNHE